MTLKSVLIATIILSVIFPTTTVLSLARTSSAKASLPSHNGHHGYHTDDQGVDTGMPKLDDMLGSQAKMLVELVPRDTESTTFKYPPSKSKHGHEIVENLRDSQFSERTAPADDSVTTISEINARHVRPARGPRPTAHKKPPRTVASKENLSELQTKSDARNDVFTEPDIYTRNAQASGGGWGRQKPKPKKNPPPGAATTPTPDILPRKIPCHRCPPLGPVEDDSQAEVLESRQFGLPYYRKPLGPHNRPSKRPSNPERDNRIADSYSRHNRPSYACDRPQCHHRPTKRDGDVGGADTQQDTNSTKVADVMRLDMNPGEVNDRNVTRAGNEGHPINATLLIIVANNGTKNGTDKLWPAGDTAGITIMYIVLMVVGFCMLLLFVIMIRHACIQRRRRNSIASRRKDYPSSTGVFQQMDGSQADFSTRNKTQGSTRMKRIDEEVAEEAQIVQSDGAGDGWTKWLLQKREV
jgi:hypothetical protein